MVFCQKKIFFIFLIERDPRKSVKLLYRESRGGRRWQSLACYRGKTKKNPKTSTIVLCLCYTWCVDKTGTSFTSDTYHGLFDLLDADRVEPLVHVDEPFGHHFQMVPLTGRGRSRRSGRGYRIRGRQTTTDGRLVVLRRHGTSRIHG